MRKATSKTILRVYGILAFVAGILFLTRSAGFGIDTSELQAIFGISDAVFRAIAFAVGAFLIAFGFQLQKHKKWTRIVALILSGIAVLGGTFFLVRCSELACTTWLLSMPLNVLRIVVGAFGLWFFGHEAAHQFK